MLYVTSDRDCTWTNPGIIWVLANHVILPLSKEANQDTGWWLQLAR